MKKNDGKILKASTILFVLNILASALNYVCQLVMARVLSVESYGTINTIFSFMMIVAVPGTTLTMVVAKYYASGSSKLGKRLYLKKQTNIVLCITAVVIILLIGNQKILSRLLSINDRLVLIIAFLLAACSYFHPLYSGVFSGNKRFILVGLYSMFIPVYKLIAISGAYYYSSVDKRRLYVLLVLMLFGVIITALYGRIKSYSIIDVDYIKVETKDHLYKKEDLIVLFLNVSLMLYMNMDLLSVRYYGDETESGLYSAVLLFGRIIYYFSTTIGTILLPIVADLSMNYTDRKNAFNKSMVVMILFAIICMAPIYIFRNELIVLLFGKEYVDASKYVLFVALISLSLSIYTIMVNYVVGVGRIKIPAMIMFGVDITLLLSVMMFSDVSSILIAISVIGVSGTLAMYIYEIIGENWFFKKIQ